MSPLRLGGTTAVASGLVYLAAAVLTYLTAPPPSDGAAILGWTASNYALLAWLNEATMISAVLLVPTVAALHQDLAPLRPAAANAGCGLLATAIPVVAMVAVMQGRLVYPVYGLIVSTPESAELVVATVFGGLHAVKLLLAAGTLSLASGMWHVPRYGRRLAILSVVTGVACVIGSYPDLIGRVPTFLTEACFAAWCGAVGLSLRRTGADHS